MQIDLYMLNKGCSSHAKHAKYYNFLNSDAE